jgi:hypothetical protein
MAVTYKIEDPNQRELGSKRDPSISPLLTSPSREKFPRPLSKKTAQTFRCREL